MLFDISNKSVKPLIDPVRQSGPSDLKVWKTLFQVLCSNSVKLVILLRSSRPGTEIGNPLFVIKVGFVPDFPILYIIVKSVVPAFVVVTYDVFANPRPLAEISRRMDVIFLYTMLDF